LFVLFTRNAHETLPHLLSAISPYLLDSEEWSTELLIIDDASSDDTYLIGKTFAAQTTAKITVLKNPVRLGYGGAQKLAFHFAIENRFDALVSIHDEPELSADLIVNLLQPIKQRQAAVVCFLPAPEHRNWLQLGCLVRSTLCRLMNMLLNLGAGTESLHFQPCCRAYSVSALSGIPFDLNSDSIEFSLEVLLQMVRAGHEVKCLSTGPSVISESCIRLDVNVGSFLRAMLTAFLYRLQDKGVFYQPKFDLQAPGCCYQPKFHFPSSHSLALSCVNPGERVLLLGCGPWELVQPFVDKGCQVTAIDLSIDTETQANSKHWIEADLEFFDFSQMNSSLSFDKVLALDIIEHLRNPERLLLQLRNSPSTSASEVVITTGNIAFLPQRLVLLAGFFNYGRRGILDMTHARLFTRRSLVQMVRGFGFDITELRGIPAPYPLALRSAATARLFLSLNAVLIRLSRGLFSYQVLVRMRAKPRLPQLLARTVSHSAALAEQHKL